MPLVSIILPTYNRERFLTDAFAAIQSQTFTDWELIVVDDGSTDGTPKLLPHLASQVTQQVRYVAQENQGAYGARNKGLELAVGKYIAFFDSDDIWLSHHLRDCVAALETHSEVDWVYGSCRVVDHLTGTELEPSTFYVTGKQRPFMNLAAKQDGALRIITDPGAAECQITHGLYGGLQNSVIRAKVFENQKIPAYRVGEDQLLITLSLIAGFTIAYIDRVHVIYRIHTANSSAASTSNENMECSILSVADAHLTLLGRSDISRPFRRAVLRRLNQEYFWKLGYAVLLQTGRRADALQMFRIGLRYWPWDWRCWKTYALASLCHFIAADFK